MKLSLDQGIGGHETYSYVLSPVVRIIYTLYISFLAQIGNKLTPQKSSLVEMFPLAM